MRASSGSPPTRVTRAVRLALLAAPLAFLPVQAAEYTYTGAYSAEYSDNIRLTPTNEENELINVLSAGFQLTETSRELDARIQARAAYRDYADNIFADESIFGLSGTLVWKPRPEVFHWTIEDVYSQVQADPTATDTPANRLDANILSTGPDIFWRISSANTLTLSARYAANTFDTADNTSSSASSSANADNTRESATVGWLYRFSPVTTFSLSHLAESVEFDDTVTTDFDFKRYQTTAGMANRFGHNQLTFQAGKTRIERRNQPDVEGGSGYFSWVREITAASTFSLNASRSLSDTGQDLLSTLEAGATGTPVSSVSTTDIFVARRASATYTRRSAPNALTLSAFRSDRIYELTTTTNEEAKGGSVEFSRTLTEAVTGTVSARFVETQFPMLPREDETRGASVGFQYRYTRTLFTSLTFSRQVRESSDPAFDYAEHRAVFSIGYNSLPSRW